MEIAKTATINAPPAKAWDLLGPNYQCAGDWASSVFASRPRPGPPQVDGAPVAGRVCETSLGPFTETIVGYRPEEMRLSYQATGDKMPGFVRSLTASWALDPVGPGKTRVSMTLVADLAPPFNVLMGWMMRRQFNKVLSESIEEFKHYVETGGPHPRKVKVDRSKQATAARQAAA